MSLKSERDLNPTSRNQVARAKAAIQSQNYDYAISLYQAVLKDEPLYLEGRQVLRAIEIKKYEATGSFARQMASMRLSGSVMKLTSTKRTPEEQLIHAEEVLAQDPYNLKANAALGEAGTALGQPEFKCFAYETLAKGKPTDKAILNTLADAYREAKEWPKAIATCERILEIDPRDGDALSKLKDVTAANASKVGNWDTAKDYREVLKSKSEAEQLEQEAKVVKSADAIEEQIAINYQKHEAEPTNPNHSKAIAQLFIQKNDYASAIPWLQHSFEASGKIDSSMEKTIGDLRLKLVEQELQTLRTSLAEQTEPEAQAQVQAALEPIVAIAAGAERDVAHREVFGTDVLQAVDGFIQGNLAEIGIALPIGRDEGRFTVAGPDGETRLLQPWRERNGFGPGRAFNLLKTDRSDIVQNFIRIFSENSPD